MLAAFLYLWLAPSPPPREARVEACGEIIGYLNGRAIPAAVRYGGRRYDFARVVPEGERRALRPGELIVEPGLLYVSAREPAP